MFFVPYVIRSDSNEKEYVQILQSSLEDFEKQYMTAGSPNGQVIIFQLPILTSIP